MENQAKGRGGKKNQAPSREKNNKTKPAPSRANDRYNDEDTASYEPGELETAEGYTYNPNWEEEDFDDYEPYENEEEKEKEDDDEEAEAILGKIPPKRNKMHLCEHCGEEYSTTYKRCPFCDERQNGGSGGGYVKSMDPRHFVGFSISMVLIITAGFIVFGQVKPLLFPQSSSDSNVSSEDKTAPEDEQDPTGQFVPSDGEEDKEATGTEGNANDDTPSEPEPSLDFTADEMPSSGGDAVVSGASGGLRVRAGAGTSFDTLATINDGSEITVLGAASDGWYQISYVGAGGNKQTGYILGDYIAMNSGSLPSGGSSSSSSSSENAGSEDSSSSSSSSSSANTLGTGAATITGASSGLRVRAGAGTSYEALATITNGSDITVVASAGDGWYEITYVGSNGGKEKGYILGEYIKMN